MFSLGLDIGYSAVKVAVVGPDGLVLDLYDLHRGQTIDTALGLLQEVCSRFGEENFSTGALVGSGATYLADIKDVCTVNEVAALVEGTLLLNPDCQSIIEIGGQNAKYITGFGGGTGAGVEVAMNPNYSSGTGSFLEEQVSRLGIAIEEYGELASRSGSVPRIAGRCSVFAKTDIIHHQQEGVSVNDVLAGLGLAVAKNFRAAVMRGMQLMPPVLFVGGVSLNDSMVSFLRQVLKLESDELTIHPASCCAAAIGSACIALREGLHLDIAVLTDRLRGESCRQDVQVQSSLPVLSGHGEGDSMEKHSCVAIKADSEPIRCWLGIDVGSTSTNIVLTNEKDEVIGYRYLRTKGNPAGAVLKGLAELQGEFGHRITVAGVGVTGSGRYLIGRLVGADVIRDEITAQARAAVSANPAVDTVIEIGGQDSKFIRLADGGVTDFQMNKVCAAGTGSFIEEQAKKLGMSLELIGKTALRSTNPIDLGERCTVFMETSIAAHMAKGARTEDLAAGLCHAIVRNYMHKVVGQKMLGQTILLQGGVAYNQGIVNAFRAVTGKKVVVGSFFSVTGALGVAILAREGMAVDVQTTFRGFRPDASIVKTRPTGNAGKQESASTFSKTTNSFIFRAYDGRVDLAKKTVGIPRTLFTFMMFPLFNTIFQELGFNVLLSNPTSENSIAMAQEYSLGETCYPVKLVNGHVAELAEKGVDYIFFPDLYTAYHPESRCRRDYGCPYMQIAFKIVSQAVDLKGKGISLLSPTFAYSLGPDFMQKSFQSLAVELGVPEEAMGAAMQKGMAALKEFRGSLRTMGKETLAAQRPDEKIFVLISKMYGIIDPGLNMGIPEKLEAMGYRIIPFFLLPEADIFDSHPNMYWPFGQHILTAAMVVREHPDMYAIYLTHHGCGPDSVTSHYFKEIMGDKPYLNIEVDEHSSDVGVITRVEAFVNSLNNVSPECGTGLLSGKKAAERSDNPGSGTLYLPRIYPYSAIGVEMLRIEGIDAREFQPTTEASVNLGRKHTGGNEYFSLVSLLGDTLDTVLQDGDNVGGEISILLPQNEGTEVDGQFSRFLQNRLEQLGLKTVSLLSPFLEDLPQMEEAHVESLFLCLLSGDLVLLHVGEARVSALEKIKTAIRAGNLTIGFVKDLARSAADSLDRPEKTKRFFAIGELSVLYNEYLNNRILASLEEMGHRVLYAPLSEYLWTLWNDYRNQNHYEDSGTVQRRLTRFECYITGIAAILGSQGHFEKDMTMLEAAADKAIGFYAGAFGRYRIGKVLNGLPEVNGVIEVSSMYENTGISLGILRKKAQKEIGRPYLSLTFDGNENKNDATRLDSFLYYS